MTVTQPNPAAVKAVRNGVVINASLAAIKLAAGIIGNTYALVADAIESSADIFASLIVWGGITIGAQPADDDHPFGHGKAEALAALVVSIMLLGAAVGIAHRHHDRGGRQTRRRGARVGCRG